MFMSTKFLPSILVPLVRLVFPRITIGVLFTYVEKESLDLTRFFYSFLPQLTTNQIRRREE
jgi:photosystem I reaction center subunit VIII